MRDLPDLLRVAENQTQAKSNVLKQILVTWMISKSVDSLQHGIALVD